MKKFLLWIPSIPFLLSFGLILVVFHVLQVIALKFGYAAHNSVVNLMIRFLNFNFWWLMSPIKFTNLAGKLPTDIPAIIISNHQSMFDIPAIGQILKKHHPKFIAKKSLAFGIPSVSYNIRNGGSIWIERPKKNDTEFEKKRKRKDTLQKMDDFAIYLNDNNRSGSIFPEGTRSRDGNMKSFKRQGVIKLLEHMPEAIIVPVALDGFWRLTQYGLKPMDFAVKLSCTVLPIINRTGKTHDQIIDEVEKIINEHVFDKK